MGKQGTLQGNLCSFLFPLVAEPEEICLHKKRCQGGGKGTERLSNRIWMHSVLGNHGKMIEEKQRDLKESSGICE